MKHLSLLGLMKVIIRSIKKHASSKKFQEVHRYGENYPDKKFYVIRRLPPRAGFFSNYHHVLGHIMIALEHDYIPVVDMENYDTFYNESDEIFGTKNAWEYYFQQPEGFSLKEAYSSAHVVLSDGLYPYEKVHPNFLFVFNKMKLTQHHNVITNFMKLRYDVNDLVIRKYEELFGQKRYILGVMSRGTDMLTKMGKKHKIQPSLTMLLSKTKELFNKWNMQWIYIATEDQNIINSFIQEFDEKLLYTNSMRISNYDEKTPTPLWQFNRLNDNYLKGLDYLIDIMLLSRCDSIICGLTNGSVAAIEINGNKFKNKYIFDLGYYS